MELYTIGSNIRKYRKQKKFSQEKLSELAGLSPNYIGAVERGEKIPALETFLRLANALDVSADMLLTDVLYRNYDVKDSLIADKLNGISPKDRERIYAVIDTLVKYSAK